MGIPFYFKKLFTIFGKKLLDKVLLGASCHTLYLDFNCLIHQCANVVVTKSPSLKQAEYEPLVIESVITGLLSLVNIVRPTKLLYIGIDGLCPKAKMCQQRKRRFMSVWRKAQDGSPQPDWDSNIITPGTRFMKALDETLEQFIETNKQLFKFEIQLSPSSDPGEGEHKIFDVMPAFQPDTVIYGLDADLILLSMVSPNSANIRLLRERPEFGLPAPIKQHKQQHHPQIQQQQLAIATPNNDYIFLKIDTLMKHMTEYFGLVHVNDYVMMSTLLGNDFLPPLSYLNIRDDGIEKVIDAYKKCESLCPGTRLVGPGPTYELNTIMLVQMINELARTEDARMDEACHKYYTVNNHMKPSVDSYPQYNKHYPMICPAQGPKWRDTYYKTLFTPNTSTQQIQSDYVEAVIWVHAYYFSRNASTTWSYPHAYSPLANDLAGATDWLSIATIERKMRITDKQVYNALLSNPILQQLSVLPPSQTFDKQLFSIMNELDHGCVHMYPSHFLIHTFLKTYLWECTPVLPTLTLKDIYTLHLASQQSEVSNY